MPRNIVLPALLAAAFAVAAPAQNQGKPVDATGGTPSAGTQARPSFDGAATDVEQQLARSLADLAALRDQVAAEQVPLQKRLRELETELQDLRAANQRVTRQLDGRTLDLGNLKTELEQRRSQIENQLASAGLTVEAYLESAEDEDAETAEEFWAGIDERSEQALRAQILLDKFADENQLDVSQQELTELIFRKAQENRTSPQDEINHMMEHNHMGDWMQEIRRGKALAAMCVAATVRDASGNVIEFPRPEGDQPVVVDAAPVAEPATPAEIATSSVVAVEEPVAEEPVEEKPRKRAAAKKSNKKDEADEA